MTDPSTAVTGAQTNAVPEGSTRPRVPTSNRSAVRRRRRGRILLTVFLGTVSFIMAVPFLWMILTSLRSTSELYSPEMTLLPQEWRFDNFRTALQRAPFALYARNSAIIGTFMAVSNLIFASMCGYALAKIRFKGSTVIFYSLLAAIMIPFYAIIIPEFLMVRHVPFFGGNDWMGQGGSGWLDSWWALLVPGMVSPFLVFMFRQFYLATPTELMESARIDGASEFRIFAQIITPLVRPGMLTVALLAFESGWNNFLWPLLVTTSQDLRTVQLGLSVFRQESGTEYTLLMAGTVMAAIPMIVLFMIFQRQFVNGFIGSGLK